MIKSPDSCYLALLAGLNDLDRDELGLAQEVNYLLHAVLPSMLV